jgi:TrmH family RNA methyltransferase
VSWPAATRAQARFLGNLRRARERRESGCCLVEGATLLGEALGAGLTPRLIAVADDLPEPELDLVRRAERAGAEVVGVSARSAERLSDREHARGLLAAVPLPPSWTGALPENGPVLAIVLCGLQDPGNVGTLLRSARAFGAAVVLATPGSADPFGPKVVRASAGASLHVPTAESPWESLGEVARRSRLAIAAARPPSAGAGPAIETLPDRCLLLLGHETQGLPELRGATTVSVPHEPCVESLNVAMAGSILMAGWYRARRGPRSGPGDATPGGGSR